MDKVLSITICYLKCVLNEISSNSIKNPLLLSLLKNQGYQSSQDAAVHNFKIKLNQQFSDDNDHVFVVSKVHKDTIDALMIWPKHNNSSATQSFPINEDLIHKLTLSN